jgi:hypothetical protein
MEQKTEKEIELEAAKKDAIAHDEELGEIKDQISTYGEAEAFSKSAGGKKLIASLEVDVFDAVILLTSKYKTASHIELISFCAGLETKIDLLRRMTQAGKKKNEAIENFDKRLKEILGN